MAVRLLVGEKRVGRGADVPFQRRIELVLRRSGRKGRLIVHH